MKSIHFCCCGVLAVMLTFSSIAVAKYDIEARLKEGQAAYVDKNFSQAAKLFHRAALKGSPVAQSFLGAMYAAGEGVHKDPARAITWYIRAANQGDSTAQTNLGLMYLKGEGIEKDYSLALRWFHQAAEQGSLDAQYNLGTMYKKGRGVKVDYLQAADWFRKAADQGDADAQFNLAIMYKKGQGVNRYYDKSAQWYRKAAEQGHAKAQTSLGVLYVTGNGVKQDYQQAVFWYLQAAKQDQPSAQNNLGWLYERGLGVERDYNKALSLYSEADNAWSKSRHAQLTKKINCLATSQTRLFMTPLKCADRDGLMQAIKEGGAQVMAENKAQWGDVYLTSSERFGTSELYVAYTTDDLFAMAKYTFGSKANKELVTQVRDVVAANYGEPDTVTDVAEKGEIKYQWTLEDGITLEVSRGWPDKTTAMTYRYPQNYELMKQAQEQQDTAQGKKRYKTKSTQF